MTFWKDQRTFEQSTTKNSQNSLMAIPFIRKSNKVLPIGFIQYRVFSFLDGQFWCDDVSVQTGFSKILLQSFSIHTISAIYAFGRCETVLKSPSLKKWRLCKMLAMSHWPTEIMLLFNTDLRNINLSYSPTHRCIKVLSVLSIIISNSINNIINFYYMNNSEIVFFFFKINLLLF